MPDAALRQERVLLRVLENEMKMEDENEAKKIIMRKWPFVEKFDYFIIIFIIIIINIRNRDCV